MFLACFSYRFSSGYKKRYEKENKLHLVLIVIEFYTLPDNAWELPFYHNYTHNFHRDACLTPFHQLELPNDFFLVFSYSTFFPSKSIYMSHNFIEKRILSKVGAKCQIFITNLNSREKFLPLNFFMFIV